MENSAEMLKKLETLLNEYENGLGIKNKNPNIQAEKYLTLPIESLQKMTPEECGEAAVVLAQYSFYLQKAYNEEVSKANWADSLIRRTLAKEAKQYNAPSADERRMMAINNNDFCLNLEKIKISAQTRADRINYLSSKVETLSSRFSELQYSKKGKNHGF